MKQPTPKADRLRELRERNYARTHPTKQRKPDVTALREKVAAVPVKKVKKAKKPNA